MNHFEFCAVNSYMVAGLAGTFLGESGPNGAVPWLVLIGEILGQAFVSPRALVPRVQAASTRSYRRQGPLMPTESLRTQSSSPASRPGARRVLVIGAGVSGLTSALCLVRSGFQVKVVAEHIAPQVTSVVAGALWEWPPAVCGHHPDQVALDRSKRWCKTSYQRFCELSANPETGVHLKPVNFYFKRSIQSDERQLAKMNDLRQVVHGFRHDAQLIRENGINEHAHLQDAYAHLAPMIDTDAYMQWLMREATEAGCSLVLRKISGDLIEQQQQLKREYGVHAIVNCTGLGARELARDVSMYPLRGALVRLKNDERGNVPRLTQAHCVSHDGSSRDRHFIFIVPRGDNLALLGGLAEANEWNLDIDLENYAPVRDMYRRCLEFLPWLAQLEIDESEPLRSGLRPFRRNSVRLEREPGTDIVHNYGHGGSGVTFSWGCAREVVAITESLFSNSPATHRI